MILDILLHLRFNNNILIHVRLLAIFTLLALNLASDVCFFIGISRLVSKFELVGAVYDLHFEFFAMT